MSKLVNWSRPVYNEFLSIALLTDDEKALIEGHVINHWSGVQKSMNLNMSQAKVDDLMKSLKKKYWEATKFSPILKDAWVGPSFSDHK